MEEPTTMATIVQYPSIVEEALKEFGDIFQNEPERRHLADYLTGLLVAEKKTVSGISRELVFGTDQSCLNRWLNEVGWNEHALNDRRLELMQKEKKTRYDAWGVISIDNTLIDHEGKLIEDVGWFWDHSENRYKIAQDLIISNYVTPFGAHYPIEWKRFRKKDTPGLKEFRDHTELCIDLIDDAIERGIPGDFTFDCYFTSAKVLNHIHERQRNYVGDLKLNRKVVFKGKEAKLSEVAKTIPADAKKEVRIGEKCYYAFTSRMRIPGVEHPVRIVIFWKKREDQEASKALVTNRLSWEIIRILLVYRNRWTGTETFHRDGKQELGLGDCQVGKGEGQTRHVYLVSTAYSLLMRALNGAGPKEWVKQRLTTIGQACRAIKKEMLGNLVDWIVDRLSHNWSPDEIKMLMRIR
jgi:hypothetical protein